MEDLKKMALLVQKFIEVNIHFYDSRSERSSKNFNEN